MVAQLPVILLKGNLLLSCLSPGPLGWYKHPSTDSLNIQLL